MLKVNSKYNTLAVVGNQWGDESKGSIVDLYATNWAEVVVRAQGGNNAGHTVTFNGEKYAVRSLPSGIFNPNIVNVIAQGCIIDPIQLLKEINNLKERGISITKDNLVISDRCHIITDYHRYLDQQIEASRLDVVKTTGNGIGPCYADKMYRLGIRVGDLAEGFNHIVEMVQDAVVCHNLCFDDNYIDSITNALIEAYEGIKEYVGNTSNLLNEFITQNKKILFEGAQAAMLDIDNGFYPFVTSSNPTTAGIAVGSGIAPKYLDTSIGVVKAYSTRVGSGPFITEMVAEIHDNVTDVKNVALANNIREKGHEYGTVTGRPRRIGWLDLQVVKEAIKMNGETSVALRLLDVLSGINKLKVCIGYQKNGIRYYGLPSTIDGFNDLQPIYVELDGWREDISNCRAWDELPDNCKKYVEFIENEIEVPITIIGVGPDREQTIFK